MTQPHTEKVCIVRGSINHDEYFHVNHIVRPGETLSSHAHESRIGGKGANQAVAIARAGGRVKFYGSIGSDGLGIKEKMGSYGVDGEDIIVADEPTGRAIIQVDAQGENSIILFPGANHSEAHERAFAAHGEGYFPPATCVLLQNEISAQATRYALEHANAQGAAVIINPSPLPAPAEILAFPWDQVTWLVVNQEEATELCDALHNARRINESGGPARGIPRELLVGLAAHAAMRKTNIVCTLGARGVLASVLGPAEEREIVFVTAAELQGDVRDTTGAGDCFTGYLVQGLMELEKLRSTIDVGEMKKILRTCVVAAGMCCEKRGTIDSIPMRDQVEERLGIS